MSKTLVVGTEEFEFPEQGENSDYGEQITDWAQAVTDALGTVQAPNDLLTTTASINNNQSSPLGVTGFSFDTTEVRSINAEYIIQRTTVSPANNFVENGFIEGNFNGTTWTITRRQTGDAGVEMDITDAGQITYTSSDISGSAYAGTIYFKAKVFNQT